MDKVKRYAALAFMLVIMAMCLVPSLGLLAFGPSEAGANEILAQPPKLSDELGANFAAPAEFRDYVADRFFGRQELITAGRRLSAGVFGSTSSKDVTVGRDGWLFYSSTLGGYTGAERMTDRELFAAAKNTALMQEYCREAGAGFLFTLTPNKNSLYGQYMPATGVVAGERDSDRFYAMLEDMDVDHLDLFELLGGSDEVLYFAHDSHWNSRGAALAADGINGALGRESRYFEGGFSEAPHTGDLFEMLYPAGRDGETDPEPQGLQFEYGPGGTRPDSITINTTSGGQGTLMCWRDSFGNALYSYLADSFAAARFSRANSYDLRLAEETGADTVVVELVERNLDYLIDYAPTIPAPERDIELPAGTAGEMEFYAENAEPEGWAIVAGELPAEPDTDSPVYISNGRAVYEAVLTRDGFRALLPAGEGPWAAAFYVGGELVSYRGL